MSTSSSSEPSLLRSSARLLALALAAALLIAAGVRRANAVAPQGDFFGMTSFGRLSTDFEASEVQNAGVHNFRLGLEWGRTGLYGFNCEQTNPLDFSFYDESFRRAAEHNITIIADLGTCGTHALAPSDPAYPVWITPGTGFVWEVVKRYGVKGTFWSTHPGTPYRPVRIWEVGNEPNQPKSAANPQGYAAALVDTASAIKAAQEAQAQESIGATQTKVLMGGLAPFNESMSLSEWFDQIYHHPSGYTTTALHNAFDGLSFHPYALAGTPADAEQKILEAREILNNYGDSAKTIWITEAGWPVGTFSSPNVTITEAQQAEYVKSLFTWIYTHADYPNFIRYAAVYDYQDNASSCGEWACWDTVSGLKRGNETEKPSWCTFKAMIVSGPCLITGWHNENLGGVINADPDIASWAPGRLDVFARGAQNQLLHRYFYNGTTWNGWEDYGNTLTSGLGAVSWGTNRIDVVARDASSNVMHLAWNGSTWTGDNPGGPISSDPDISSWAPNRLDVFAVGSGGTLRHTYWNGVAWSSWESLGGPSLTSSPSAVSWSNGRIDVVARTTDNSVNHWWFDGISWHPFDNLGGTIKSAPEISSWAPGRLDVFAEGTDEALWHKFFYNGTTWSGWERLGGHMASGPGAVSWGSARIDVVFRSNENSVAHWWFSE